MNDAGLLTLNIAWNGKTASAVSVDSTRPQASRLLAGRTPDQVIQIVPLLFSLCAKAQHAAAITAIASARGHEVDSVGLLEQAVAIESMQEHLWRIMLDWPQLLHCPAAFHTHFARWREMLNALGAGQGDAATLLRELYQHLLGLDESEWNGINSYEALRAWWPTGGGLAAPLLSSLDQLEDRFTTGQPSAICGLMPKWTVADARSVCGERFDPEFAARPEVNGMPLEVGTLADHQDSPLLKDVLRARPSRILARFVARLADLMDSAVALARHANTGRVNSTGGTEHTGISLVRTARGVLIHQVSLEGGAGAEKVAAYQSVAPTEWNFHPRGPFASGFTGVGAESAVQLKEMAGVCVLSLDPCVEYRIEVRHA